MSTLRHFRPRSGGLPIDRRLLHPGACRKSIMGMTRVELLRSEGGTLHRESKNLPPLRTRSEHLELTQWSDPVDNNGR